MLAKLKILILKNIKVIIWISFLFVLLISFIVINIQNSRVNKKLLNNASFTTGQFNGELEPYRKGTNGPWYLCYYQVNGKKFSASEPVHLCEKLGKDFFNQRFPVIYDSTNPAFSRVLVFPFEFEEFNIKFPDSLNWVLTKK